jgi:two-component system, OmpR family, sensor histidine kinase KdpD
MAEEHPAPESFLDLVAEQRKGRLKIYVGAAAGVGKTWRMLEEAHDFATKASMWC